MDDFEKEITEAGWEKWKITETDDYYKVYSDDGMIAHSSSKYGALVEALEFNGIYVKDEI